MSKFKKLKDLFFGEGGKGNTDGKSKVPKTPKGGKSKVPKSPKGGKSPGGGVPSFTMETWKSGERLVCRLNGKFCPIPEAMKQWKAQRKANPKPKKPLVKMNPLKKLFTNKQLAKKGMTVPGSNDPTKILPGSNPGARDKTTVRGNAPRGKIVKQGASGVQTRNKKAGDLARKFAPELERKTMDPFTRGIGGEKTRIQTQTSPPTRPQTKPQTSPPTRPQTKPQTPPPSSPPTRPQTQPPTSPLSEGRIPTSLETSPATTPQTKPKTRPVSQSQVPTQGDNPTQIFNPGRQPKASGGKADITPIEGVTGFEGGGKSATPAQIFNRDNPLANRHSMPTRIEKNPKTPTPPPKTPTPPPRQPKTPTTPNKIAAQGEAWRLRQKFGENIPTTGKRAIAKFEAQKIRQKLEQVKEILGKKSKAPTPLDTTLRPSTDPGISVEITQKTGVGTRLKQNIKSIGEGIESLGKSAKAAAARGVIAANEAVYEAVKRGKSLARNAGNQSRRFIQGVGESVKKAGQQASETMRNVTPPRADVVKNIQNKDNVVKTVQKTMTAKGAGEAIKQVAKKGSKSVREAVGEGINKGIEILTDPAVQIGLEVARTPHTLKELKDKKAGPFETALTVGGRIVGAGAESVLIPEWVPSWVRLFTFGEDIGGAVAGTAGKVIDKSGAGKVIIDTTTTTAKALDKKFPGAPQIDINKQRTRPKFKELTGEL